MTERFMNLLKRHRLAAGLSQTALARRLKLKGSSAVCHWEDGTQFPSAEYYPKLARILGVDRMDLTYIIENSKEELQGASK